MSKPKVYLSTSKAGNYETIRAVRHYLQLFNIELLEYVHTNSQYDSTRLLSCDVLIIIPPTPIINENTTVGRGQYNEFEIFKKSYPNRPIYIMENILKYNSLVNNKMCIGDIVHTKLLEKNWTTLWAAFKITNIKLIDSIFTTRQDILNKEDMIDREYLSKSYIHDRDKNKILDYFNAYNEVPTKEVKNDKGIIHCNSNIGKVPVPSEYNYPERYLLLLKRRRK